MKRLSLPVPKGCTSSLKKRREKVKTMAERAITTAQELRTYARASKYPNEIVVIYGLFLWGLTTPLKEAEILLICIFTTLLLMIYWPTFLRTTSMKATATLILTKS
ncbi:hypothetical protein F443_09910 [Phytophthora nicotianae P1569]|uniref:Uncharacterized protein n=1 Tax=Phytophthora nicotianae P1569 TaxID=1317065 RepID=V9F5D6_PHYNI|nr:hypothetical protein F443_09910 [Phytophthora nicotianae P1569]